MILDCILPGIYCPMELLKVVQKKVNEEILKKRNRKKKEELTTINYCLFVYVTHQF